MNRKALSVEEVTWEGITPFGSLISTSVTDPTVAKAEFSFWDALGVDTVTNGMSVGIVEVRPSSYVGNVFERHVATAELLAPLDGEMILVLGEPTGTGLPDPNRFSAFRVPLGSAVLLHPGTWHYAPVATETIARVLVVYGIGTAENDKEIRHIGSELGIEFLIKGHSECRESGDFSDTKETQHFMDLYRPTTLGHSRLLR